MATITYTFASLKQAVIDYAEDDFADFATELPSAIGRAELACYRDLDLEIFDQTDTTKSTVAGTKTLATPDNSIMVRSLRLGTTRVLPRARTMIEHYQDIVPAGTPLYFCEISDAELLLAPVPDAVLLATQVAVIRPAGLSDSNTTSWLSLNAPDLLFWATMKEVRGWQQAVDDPTDLAHAASEYAAKLAATKAETRHLKRVDYR